MAESTQSHVSELFGCADPPPGSDDVGIERVSAATHHRLDYTQHRRAISIDMVHSHTVARTQRSGARTAIVSLVQSTRAQSEEVWCPHARRIAVQESTCASRKNSANAID